MSEEPLTEILKYLPGKVAQCRIFAMTHQHDQQLARALNEALGEDRPDRQAEVGREGDEAQRLAAPAIRRMPMTPASSGLSARAR